MKKLILIATLMITQLASAHEPQEVNLMGYTVDSAGVTIQVYSGGCTEKSDFYAESIEENGLVELTFYRINPDVCLAFFPYGLKLKFRYEELGIPKGAAFRITNHIEMTRRSGK